MRIVGEIPHPELKITIFKNDGLFSVKCESGLIEQIFKFRDDEHLQSPEDLKKMFDAAFIEKIEAQLKNLKDERESAYVRNFKMADEGFPEII